VAVVGGIAEAMADQIRAALEGHGWDFQVEPKWVINPTPPTVDVMPGDTSTESSESGAMGETAVDMADGLWYTVRARVAPNDYSAGQEILYELLSPDSELSIVQALYDDPTLGGAAADVSFDSARGFLPFPTVDGGSFHIGVTWRFLVLPAFS